MILYFRKPIRLKNLEQVYSEKNKAKLGLNVAGMVSLLFLTLCYSASYCFNLSENVLNFLIFPFCLIIVTFSLVMLIKNLKSNRAVMVAVENEIAKNLGLVKEAVSLKKKEGNYKLIVYGECFDLHTEDLFQALNKIENDGYYIRSKFHF